MAQTFKLTQTEFGQQLERFGAAGLASRLQRDMAGIFDGKMQFIEGLKGIVGWYLEGRLQHNFSIEMLMNRGLSLQFVQAVRGQRQIGERRPRNFVGGSFYLSCFPDGALQQRHFEKGAVLRYVGIWVTPDLLKSQFLDADRIDNEQIAEFLNGDLKASIDLNGPLSVRMQTSMDDLFENEFDGRVRRKFIQAKMTELICSALPSLTHERHTEVKISRATRQALKVQRAAVLLKTRLTSPPSSRDLAREVSIGHNLLNALFREMFGCTVHQYSKRCRMKQAEILLHNRKHSMIEVANLIGYNCQSSFSRAYRAYYGKRPSDTRLSNG